MNKIINIVIILSIMFNINVLAEDKSDIEGFKECMESLYITNVFSSERIEEMRLAWRESLIETLTNTTHWYAETRPYYNLRVVNDDDTKEDAIRKIVEYREPNFQNGILMSCFTIRSYAKFYSAKQRLGALFGIKYWFFDGSRIRDLDGNPIGNFQAYSTTVGGPGQLIEKSIEYIHNYDDIYSRLVKYGVSKVSEVHIFTFGGADQNRAYLYFDTDLGELILKFQNYYLDPDEELYQIQPAETLFDDFFMTNYDKPDYTTEAEYLADQGLLYGNENGLDLLKPMTRAEAATILMRALGGENQTPQVASFSDVPTNYWGFEPIEKASRLGIVKGVGDGLFDPEARVTENQFATMLLRTANETNFDWQTAITLFVERGYITQEQADRMDLFTRGDMAKLIYEAKQHGIIR